MNKLPPLVVMVPCHRRALESPDVAARNARVQLRARGVPLSNDGLGVEIKQGAEPGVAVLCVALADRINDADPHMNAIRETAAMFDPIPPSGGQNGVLRRSERHPALTLGPDDFEDLVGVLKRRAMDGGDPQGIDAARLLLELAGLLR